MSIKRKIKWKGKVYPVELYSRYSYADRGKPGLRRDLVKEFLSRVPFVITDNEKEQTLEVWIGKRQGR